MNTTKKTMPQITILVLYKRLESFLMNVEVIFLVKKQRELELCRIEAVYNVLKEKEQKGSLTSRQKNMLRNDERYLKDLKKRFRQITKISA